MSRRGTIEAFVAACLAGDEARASSLFATDGVFREPDRAPVTGRAAIADHFGEFFHHGPEWRWTVEALLEAGDRCVAVYRFALKGSDGEWHEHDGCAIVSFAADGIAEWREFRG
jgi:ketosteroid isomerase-like protein